MPDISALHTSLSLPPLKKSSSTSSSPIFLGDTLKINLCSIFAIIENMRFLLKYNLSK
jgi:hypothetical protein